MKIKDIEELKHKVNSYKQKEKDFIARYERILENYRNINLDMLTSKLKDARVSDFNVNLKEVAAVTNKPFMFMKEKKIKKAPILRIISRGEIKNNFMFDKDVPACIDKNNIYLYVDKVLVLEEDKEFVDDIIIHELGHFFSDGNHENEEFKNTVRAYNEYYNKTAIIDPTSEEVTKELMEKLPLFKVSNEILEKYAPKKKKDFNKEELENEMNDYIYKIIERVFRQFNGSSLQESKKLSAKVLKRLVTKALDKDDKFLRRARTVAIMSCSSPTGAVKDGVAWKSLDSDNPELKEKAEQVWGATSCKEWNYNSNKEFVKWIKSNAGYKYKKVIGLYEDKEISYIIINATKDEIEKQARKYCQKSYMFVDMNNTSVSTENDAITYIETFEREDDINSEYKSIGLPYGLTQDNTKIDLDNFEVDPTNPKFQTRIDSDKGFSLKYSHYDAKKPTDPNYDRYNVDGI